MFVEIRQSLRIGRTMHRDHPSLAPAQVQQALGVIGMIMGLQDTAETVRRKTFAEIRQAAVDQPALVATLHQGTAWQTP